MKPSTTPVPSLVSHKLLVIRACSFLVLTTTYNPQYTLCFLKGVIFAAVVCSLVECVDLLSRVGSFDHALAELCKGLHVVGSLFIQRNLLKHARLKLHVNHNCSCVIYSSKEFFIFMLMSHFTYVSNHY